MLAEDAAFSLKRQLAWHDEQMKKQDAVWVGGTFNVEAVRALLAAYEANECYNDALVQKFYDLEQQQTKYMRENPKHEELHRTKRNAYIDAGFWAKRLWRGPEPGGEKRK